MSSPKAPRATLLGFPWKPANVYLPRSTMHPWRRINNGTKVASRMAQTCRSIWRTHGFSVRPSVGFNPLIYNFVLPALH